MLSHVMFGNIFMSCLETFLVPKCLETLCLETKKIEETAQILFGNMSFHPPLFFENPFEKGWKMFGNIFQGTPNPCLETFHVWKHNVWKHYQTQSTVLWNQLVP